MMVGSMTCEHFLRRYDDPQGKHAVVLEDDGRVAYAYLLRDESLVSDVWLYNVEATPEHVDWKDRSAMPFLNPRGFCADELTPRLREDAVIYCRWLPHAVEVLIDEVLIARLEPGAKPGWSKLAARSGPLARPLVETART
jgi:hypothetical protein